MPIRKPKPTSPGRRFITFPDFQEITKTEPERTLVEATVRAGDENAGREALDSSEPDLRAGEALADGASYSSKRRESKHDNC